MDLVPAHKRDTAVSLLRSFDTEGNGRVSSSDYHRVLQMLNVAVPVGHQAAEGGVAYTERVQERDARPAQDSDFRPHMHEVGGHRWGEESAPAADEMRPHMHEVGGHRWGEESAPTADEMRPHMHEVGGHRWGEECKPAADEMRPHMHEVGDHRWGEESKPAADEMRPHMHEVGNHRWGEESKPAAGMRPHMHEVGGHRWGEETKPCEDDAYRFRRPAARGAADVVASLMTRLDGNPLPLRNAMRQSDGDKDGILSKREFTQALERIGVDTTGVREQELLAAIGRLVPQQVCFIVCPCRMHVSGVPSGAVVLLC